MTDIKVVIGANFGDEGKGLMTDYFCHQAISQNKKCIVVLSNGGSQRGHTVDTIDDKTHVFRHFGSGSFAYADTFCSQYYIVNPMTFRQEFYELMSLKCVPKCYVDYRCKWSTPFDMLINQIVEQSRENKKHGSCGVGIWETEYRYATKPMMLNINQFNNLSYDKKTDILINLRDNYFINRLKEYGIPSIPLNWRDIYYSSILIDNFISDVNFFCVNTVNCTNSILKYYDTVVCENGQGLLLDQSLVDFYGDNLTPSNTGSLNSYNLIRDTFNNNYNVELCYVSRTYMTRHGAGKFVTECNKDMINKDMFDVHNVCNDFQDELRYGELIVPQLMTRIDNDSQIFRDAKVSLTLTHTNEFQIDCSELEKYNLYLSNGKTRNSVKINNL